MEAEMQTLARLGSQWAAVSCLLADTLPHTAASPPHAASHGGAGVVEAQRQAAGAEPVHALQQLQQLQQQVAVLEREGEELRRGRAVAEKERDAARVELEAMRAGAAVGGAAREVALMKEAEVAAVERLLGEERAVRRRESEARCAADEVGVEAYVYIHILYVYVGQIDIDTA